MTDEKVADITTRKMAIGDIKPAKYNPRIELKPDDKEYRQIEASIDGFGYIDPLVMNESNNVLISGHQRLNILKARGYTHIVVSIVREEDMRREKAMNLAMNKLRGREDPAKLKEIFNAETYDELLALAGYEKAEFEQAKNWEETIPEDDLGKMPKERKEIYDSASIKQIVLYYNNEEFENRVTRLRAVAIDLDVESNTQVIDALLIFYEHNHNRKKKD